MIAPNTLSRLGIHLANTTTTTRNFRSVGIEVGRIVKWFAGCALVLLALADLLGRFG
jgi:hypothetical protein